MGRSPLDLGSVGRSPTEGSLRDELGSGGPPEDSLSAPASRHLLPHPRGGGEAAPPPPAGGGARGRAAPSLSVRWSVVRVTGWTCSPRRATSDSARSSVPRAPA